ncbi:MAG TPA: hypothetical protein VG844_04775 [Terracidiphilus sp.]|nr:hypothetical protein [Terracidiphilus sp.]
MISRRSVLKTGLGGAAAVLAGQAGIIHSAAEPAVRPAPMRFGVNYTPRKRWWFCWLDWDQQAVQDDLEGVASLGMDHIRIQCLWPMFQPGISSVNEQALANLHSLLEAADRSGLDVEVTVLNGWMSGLSFLPSWVMPLARKQHGDDWNIFTSRAVIDAEKLLFRRIAETAGSHRRFMGFDIGNELGVLQAMNNPVTPTQADAWAREMLAYCEEIAPGKFHVNGTDHTHWFTDFGFTRPMLATAGSATVMHSYIYFTGVLDHYKYSEPAAVHIADYMIELGVAYQTDPLRKIWVEEIGLAGGMPSDYEPQFMEKTMRNIATTGKAWGLTWWCSHDIDPRIKSFDGGEYIMGLLDLKNQPKVIGKKFAELAKEMRQNPPAAAVRTSALVIPDEGLSKKSWPPDWTFAKPFMDLIEQGVTPAIVLKSRTEDAEYLRSRGIEKLIPLG